LSSYRKAASEFLSPVQQQEAEFWLGQRTVSEPVVLRIEKKIFKFPRRGRTARSAD
jgi:hypothetical protein